jgi:hypothetical protein
VSQHGRNRPWRLSVKGYRFGVVGKEERWEVGRSVFNFLKSLGKKKKKKMLVLDKKNEKDYKKSIF